jgi:hypothetical protein
MALALMSKGEPEGENVRRMAGERRLQMTRAVAIKARVWRVARRRPKLAKAVERVS